MKTQAVLSSQTVSQTEQVAFYLSNISVNRSKGELYTSGLNKIRIWDFITGKLRHEIDIPLEDDNLWPRSTPSFIISDDSTNTLYVGFHNGQILIHNCFQSTTFFINTHKSKITNITIQNQHIFVTSLDRHFSIYSVSTRELQFYTKLQEPIISATIDSNHFYVLLRTGLIQGFNLSSRKVDIIVNSYIEGENKIIGIMCHFGYLIAFNKKEILFFSEQEISHSINVKGLNIKQIKIYPPRDNKTKDRFVIQQGDRKLVVATIDRNLESKQQEINFHKFFKKTSELQLKYKIVDFYLHKDNMIVSTTGNRIYNYLYNVDCTFEKAYVIGKNTHFSGVSIVGFSEINNQEENIKTSKVIFSVSKNLVVFRDSNLNMIQKAKTKSDIISCTLVDNFCFVFDKKGSGYVYDLKKGRFIYHGSVIPDILNVQTFSNSAIFKLKSSNIGHILFGKSVISIVSYNIKKNTYEILYTKKLGKEVTSGIYLPKRKWMALATIECKVELFKLDVDDRNSVQMPNRPLFSMYGHSLPITTLSTDTEETLLYTGSMDKSMKVFNLQFGDLVKTCIGHKEEITKIVSFGEYLLTTSRDRKIIVWSSNKYKLLKEIKTLHYGDVWDIETTPDMLITACEDRSVRSIPYDLFEDYISIKEENETAMELEENIEANKFIRFQNIKTKISASLKWKAVYLKNFVRSFYDEVASLSEVIRGIKGNKYNMEIQHTNNIPHYKTAMRIQQNDSLFNKILSTWNFSELDELFRAESEDFKDALFYSMLFCFNESNSNVSLNYSFICKKYFENNNKSLGEHEKKMVNGINSYLNLLNEELTKTIVLSEMA